MGETTLHHFIQQVRALPDAQWGCLLWDDARAFKSDAIGSRKKKGAIPGEIGYQTRLVRPVQR